MKYRFLILIFLAYACSSNDEKQARQRWASGDYKKAQELKLDVEAIQESFQSAKSPTDFEKKVNEIYTGEDIISINVADKGQKNQVVSLYIDKKPQNGAMDADERKY